MKRNTLIDILILFLLLQVWCCQNPEERLRGTWYSTTQSIRNFHSLDFQPDGVCKIAKYELQKKDFEQYEALRWEARNDTIHFYGKEPEYYKWVKRNTIRTISSKGDTIEYVTGLRIGELNSLIYNLQKKECNRVDNVIKNTTYYTDDSLSSISFFKDSFLLINKVVIINDIRGKELFEAVREQLGYPKSNYKEFKSALVHNMRMIYERLNQLYHHQLTSFESFRDSLTIRNFNVSEGWYLDSIVGNYNVGEIDTIFLKVNNEKFIGKINRTTDQLLTLRFSRVITNGQGKSSSYGEDNLTFKSQNRYQIFYSFWNW